MSTPLSRARRSLEGLSVGDGFGQMFFSSSAIHWMDRRRIPPAPWKWTDDTAMGSCLFEILRQHGHVEQDAFAKLLAETYREDSNRGYGGGAQRLLEALLEGADWRKEAACMFMGEGSMGNGSAMRVAPLGAFYADDVEKAKEQAALSSQVTHLHPEGQAGAVAVAIAAALVAGTHSQSAPRTLFNRVIEQLPDSLVRDMIAQARDIPASEPIRQVVECLGNGDRILAWDTVPFTLWCAFNHLHDYEKALWTCVSARGDRDTTCAIVGGIVAAAGTPIPAEWIAAREALPV